MAKAEEYRWPLTSKSDSKEFVSIGVKSMYCCRKCHVIEG